MIFMEATRRKKKKQMIRQQLPSWVLTWLTPNTFSKTENALNLMGIKNSILSFPAISIQEGLSLSNGAWLLTQTLVFCFCHRYHSYLPQQLSALITTIKHLK